MENERVFKVLNKDAVGRNGIISRYEEMNRRSCRVILGGKILFSTDWKNEVCK